MLGWIWRIYDIGSPNWLNDYSWLGNKVRPAFENLPCTHLKCFGSPTFFDESLSTVQILLDSQKTFPFKMLFIQNGHSAVVGLGMANFVNFVEFKLHSGLKRAPGAFSHLTGNDGGVTGK